MCSNADMRLETLSFMVLMTIQAIVPTHGYGIARRIEQTSAIMARFLAVGDAV